MKNGPLTFGVRHLVFVVFVVSTLFATLRLGMFAVFLLAIMWCAAIINARSRFKWQNRRLTASLHGVTAAMVFRRQLYWLARMLHGWIHERSCVHFGRTVHCSFCRTDPNHVAFLTTGEENSISWWERFAARQNCLQRDCLYCWRPVMSHGTAFQPMCRVPKVDQFLKCSS